MKNQHILLITLIFSGLQGTDDLRKRELKKQLFPEIDKNSITKLSFQQITINEHGCFVPAAEKPKKKSSISSKSPLEKEMFKKLYEQPYKQFKKKLLLQELGIDISFLKKDTD